MMAILDIKKGRNKFFLSYLATALSALVLLTAIHIAIKIAIIASAAIITYSLLSLIHKTLVKKNDVSTQTEEQSDVSEDEGYNSGGEDKEKDTGISAEGREEIEAELEAEIIRAKAEEEMKNGLPEHIVLAVQASNEQSASQDDKSQTQYKSDYMSLMQSPPLQMNGFYQASDTPSTFINGAGPERWLLENAPWVRE